MPNLQPTVQLYPGLRVGSVELVAEVEPRDSIEGSTHRRQWDVICDCGGHAYRTVDRLVFALQHDQDTCCEKCLQELRRGLQVQYIERRIQAGKSRTAFFVWLFKKTGRLYSTLPRGDPNEVTLDTLQVDTFSLSCGTYETEPGNGNPDYPQQEQWLTPLESTAGWVCYHCEKPFTKGHGCLRCLTRLCDSCKNEGAHCCPSNWTETWKDEVKDDGLLTRRTQLLNLKPLKLTTHEDIEAARKADRDSYIQWKWEQKQICVNERREYVRQARREALERRTAESLERAKRRAETKAQMLARKEAEAKAKRKEKLKLQKPKVKYRNPYLKYIDEFD
jgi:hypothetical protein